MPVTDLWILSAARTPIGRFLGGLSSMSAVELGVVAGRGAIERAGLDVAAIDEAIIGCVLSAGLGQAPARQVALGCGMPATSSALTVNMVCGSGLRAVMLARTAIAAGESQIVLAGGVESMSNAPHLLRGGRSGFKFGDQTLVDSMLFDGLTCPFEHQAMGAAAEHTADLCGLTRGDLDTWSVESHRRACAAQQAGFFKAEIVPTAVPGRKGQTSMVEVDEGPRIDATRESLAKLSSSFRAEGVVTAGNASMLSDGAAMLVAASEAAMRRFDCEPMARMVGQAVSGIAPAEIFLAPINAVRRLLGGIGWSAEDVDLFEINEAFASQTVACVRRLQLDPAKVNVNGGAIALGHPIGASGARVLVTLLHALEARRLKRGVATLCLGGGNAVAVAVERP